VFVALVLVVNKHSVTDRDLSAPLIPIQKASGGPRRSQQRKRPHPTNRAKSSQVT